eukprot:15472-Eustigmatos_ZCMA.PRE.1
MAIWEAEAHAEEHREKKRVKEGTAEPDKPMVKVKVWQPIAWCSRHLWASDKTRTPVELRY